jgi:hypothetical protein
VLRKIYGPKREEFVGDWRRIHQIKEDEMGEIRNTYKMLVGNPEEKRPLRRPRRKWEDNIIMDITEIG